MSCPTRYMLNWAQRQLFLAIGFTWVLTTLAAAQGTRDYTCTVQKSYDGCSSPAPLNFVTFSNWSFTDSSGKVHHFNGSSMAEAQETYTIDGHNRTCGSNDEWVLDTNSTDGLYHIRTCTAPNSTACCATIEPVGGAKRHRASSSTSTPDHLILAETIF